MKRLRQYLTVKYLQWKIARWQKYVGLLLQHGDVRQLRSFACQCKSAGVRYGYPEFTRLGEMLDSHAEMVVLRRIGFK